MTDNHPMNDELAALASMTATDGSASSVTWNSLSETQREHLDELISELDKRESHPEGVYWLSGDDADEGISYCYDCVKLISPNGKLGVDFMGGSDNEEQDGCELCEECGNLLGYVLTSYGVKSELAHFVEHGFDWNNANQCYELARVAHGIYEDDEQYSQLYKVLTTGKNSPPTNEALSQSAATQAAPPSVIDAADAALRTLTTKEIDMLLRFSIGEATWKEQEHLISLGLLQAVDIADNSFTPLGNQVNEAVKSVIERPAATANPAAASEASGELPQSIPQHILNDLNDIDGLVENPSIWTGNIRAYIAQLQSDLKSLYGTAEQMNSEAHKNYTEIWHLVTKDIGEWDYPAQVVRHVGHMAEDLAALRSERDALRTALEEIEKPMSDDYSIEYRNAERRVIAKNALNAAKDGAK